MPARRLLWLLALIALGQVACGAGAGGATGTALAPAPDRRDPDPPARAAARLRLVPVGGSFSQPLYVTAPRGDASRVFVVEKGGRIRVVRGGRRLAAPFLDLSGQVSTGYEQGLLSMTFAPDYAASGRFYVSYTDRAGNSRVEEYRRATPDRASRASRRLVLYQRQPEANHNGGLITFGPDRMLYIGFGDGGGANDQHGSPGNGQSLGSLLGKLLRIDPRPAGGRPYRIPSGNPFMRRGGARPEIYAYGLRNPWRFSFDRANGNLIIADVGQYAVEEINFVLRSRAAGRNYGWRVWEGRRRNYADQETSGPAGPTFPVLTYALGSGNCSVTGGYVIRDRGLRGHYGRYVYGDHCRGQIRTVLLGPGFARGDAAAGLSVPQLSSFGEDASGRVYVTSLNGRVFRLAAG